MTKAKNNKKFIYLIFIAIVLVIGFVVFKIYSHTNYNNISDNQTQSNLYTSPSLKLSINVPVIYKISNGMNSIFFTNNIGEIRITRQGTNFNDLNGYLTNLGSDIKNKEESVINGVNSTSGIIDDQKYYFIYVNNWVYSLSTSSPALYGDLDTIARSFKYTP